MNARKPRRFVDYLRARGHRLTPAQRVLCLVCFDDVELSQLVGDDRDTARQLFGPNVENICPEARNVVAWLKGARVGGTWLCALYLGYRTLTADLSGLAAGEMAFAAVVAPDMKTGRQGVRFALGDLRSDPTTARLIESETADGFIVRRQHDGRRVSVECLAASRGGASLRGRTMVAGLMDESSFFRDPDSGVVNDSEIYRAMIVRIRGGKLCVISTAWMESGLLWQQLVQRNYDRQETAIGVIAPTLFMRPDDRKLVSIIAEERARDPENAAREFDCVPFAQGASNFFDGAALAAAVDDDAPLILEPAHAAETYCGLDTAFRRDASAAVIVRAMGRLIEVAETVEIAPPKGGLLVPSETLARLLERARYHGCRTILADQHYSETVRELARGFTFREAPGGIEGKMLVYTVARTAIHEGRVRIPGGNRKLLTQLREVISKPTPGGNVTISSPRRAGSHGDLVSAFVLAVWCSVRAQRRDDFGVLGSGGRYADGPNMRGSLQLAITGTQGVGCPLLQRRAGSIALLRSLLQLPLNAPYAGIADAIEACANANDADAITALLTRITGCSERSAALEALRSGRAAPSALA